MVARVITGKSIRGILHYNEHKVQEGAAKLILASGFAGEIGRMAFRQKLNRFENLNLLRPSVKTNALHITLNFDASEKLDAATLQRIAMTYMERIGFGEQPFLVYQHNDVAHQHIHIATTSIRRDGNVIDVHHIGRDLSEPARKAIEKEFNLVPATSKTYKQQPAIKAADIEKALYGQIPTKRAISNVVTAVSRDYLFTSLAEYNAVLQQFNVRAERGPADSEMYQNKGLIYTLLDKAGQPVGIPIKASAFYSKPTLRNLERQFERGKEMRHPYTADLKQRIEQVFGSYQRITKGTFISQLQQQGVAVVFRTNEQGFTYGATFIDHKNRTVFNGSDIGREYSAKKLTERFAGTDQPKAKPLQIALQPKLQQYIREEQPKNAPAEAPVNYLRLALGKYQPDSLPSIPRKKKRKKNKEHAQDQDLTL
jgi:nitrogen fixation protein FixH